MLEHRAAASHLQGYFMTFIFLNQGKVEAMCEKAIKPTGCFNDSVTDRALGNFLTSYRPSLQNDGITVDWSNYQVSLNR